VLVFSSLFIVQGFFCLFVFAGVSICPWGYTGLSKRWLGGYCVMLGFHLFHLLNVSKQAWREWLEAVAAHLCSRCTMEWRSFSRARCSRCQSFDSLLCFMSAKSSSIISARFLIHGAHTVCFCTQVAILDPNLYISFYKNKFPITKFTYPGNTKDQSVDKQFVHLNAVLPYLFILSFLIFVYFLVVLEFELRALCL
jgi:hypothetical protein